MWAGSVCLDRRLPKPPKGADNRRFLSPDGCKELYFCLINQNSKYAGLTLIY